MERADLDFVTDERQQTKGKSGFGIVEGVLWDYTKLTKESAGPEDQGRTRVCVCIHQAGPAGEQKAMGGS